jgi:hypothetical protein
MGELVLFHGSNFLGFQEIMKTFICDFTYYCLFELFFTMPPLKIQPIMATIIKQLGLELLMNP